MPFVHITPSCPRCGSIYTKRYIIYSGTHRDNIIAQYMRKGELVEPVSNTGSHNLCCCNCDAEWTGTIEYTYLTYREIKTLKERLGITNTYISEYENAEVRDNLKRKKAKKELLVAKWSKKRHKLAINQYNEDIPEETSNKKEKRPILSFLGKTTYNLIIYPIIDPFTTMFGMFHKEDTKNKGEEE